MFFFFVFENNNEFIALSELLYRVIAAWQTIKYNIQVTDMKRYKRETFIKDLLTRKIQQKNERNKNRVVNYHIYCYIYVTPRKIEIFMCNV